MEEKMQVYEELVARGLIAQVTNEEEIRDMVIPDALAVQRGSIHIKILADGLGDGAKAQTGAKVNAGLHAPRC